jgi:GrpB-like predicted nucleotidyltransferase (UPF0157 family)
MIGLKRHTVELVDHNAAWPTLAAEICQAVFTACGDLVIDVQHVGSTAVPGLPAKPILDIAAGVGGLGVIPELVEKLARIGYIYRGDGGENAGHLFVKESAPDVRTVHLHVVVYGDLPWQDYLRFRELLRHDGQVRRQYTELKKQLGARFAGDRKAYTAGKEDFIRALLSQRSTQGHSAAES